MQKASSTNTTERPLSGSIYQFKTCRHCGQKKPRTGFYKQRSRQRYRPDCIECTAEQARAAQGRESQETAPTERRCRGCRLTQPIAEFAPDARCQGGHAYECEYCVSRRTRERKQRRRQLNLPDPQIEADRKLREQRNDLGIAIAHATCPPGHCRTLEEIAAYTGMTVQGVRIIEQRALWKMRKRAQALLIQFELANLREGGLGE